MPDTPFFCPELFDFLRQLKRHNNRDWFAKNKQRYEEAVRDPALMFISSFGPHLRKLSPHFVADPRPTRGSLFRIYRDTRFSADKHPYKTHVGIHFSHASGKDAHAPVCKPANLVKRKNCAWTLGSRCSSTRCGRRNVQ